MVRKRSRVSETKFSRLSIPELEFTTEFATSAEDDFQTQTTTEVDIAVKPKVVTQTTTQPAAELKVET